MLSYWCVTASQDGALVIQQHEETESTEPHVLLELNASLPSC